MRSINKIDESRLSFALVCPGYARAKRGGGEWRTKDGLTFTIGSHVVAEISHGDLLESWAAAGELSPSESLKMTELAASHLNDILQNGLAAGDLTEAVTDAAVVFLLALKRKGIKDPKRIPSCTVMWNGQESREHVLLGS